MKKVLSIIIFLAIFQSIWGQLPVLLNDKFNNPSDMWSEYDNEYSSCGIKNGYYFMNNKTSKYIYRYYNTKFVDPNKDFEIRTILKQISGADNYGYGLIWFTESWRNGYAFVISSNGYFRIYGYKDEKYEEIKEWTETKQIKPKGKNNELKITRFGNTYRFYINGTKVFTTTNLQARGFNQGFILTTKMMVVANEFEIRQEETKINLVGGLPPNIKKENLGTNINTRFSEIAPIISADGKTLYFGRSYLELEEYPDSSNFDIYYSQKQPNGKWGKAKRMPFPINNEGDNLIVSISPDGNTLLLEGLYDKSGHYISDEGISISHKTYSGWEIPQQVIIKDYYNLNIYETFCPSPDGNVLILSIQRRDSKGGEDLYVSFRQNDGTFSVPRNIAQLNTVADEGTPFLAPDGKTLYFYSEGRAGYGSADIYVAKRLDDTWLHWSEPKNLGKPINSEDWDTYYTVSAKGDYAYLVSTANSIGRGDIFSVQLAEEAKPDPVVLVSGKVFNAKNNKPIGATIYYEDLKSGKKLGFARSNPRTGEFTIVLPYGKNYGVRAEAKNFISTNENFDFSDINEYKEIKHNLYLTPIEVGQSVKMNNVFFVRGKAILTKESYPELDRLVSLMKENPKMEIRLEGHTESGGNRKQELLLQLSEQRVAAVKRYLVDKGISTKRITGKGFGGLKPLVTGNVDQSINRRVEFVITKK